MADSNVNIEVGYQRISDAQLSRLARSIATRDLEAIALEFLGLETPANRNMRDNRVGNMAASNFDILENWRNRHPGPNQCKVRFNKLSNSD